MTSGDLTALAGVAEAAALEAAAILSQHRAVDTVVLDDRDRELKIAADREAERTIVRVLGDASRLPILTEEAGWLGPGAVAGRYWVVDPLDGTYNYYRGIPMFAVSIALWEGDRPLLGVVHDCTRSEVFTGIVGEGASMNGRTIHTSTQSLVAQSVLFSGLPVSLSLTAEATRDTFGRIVLFKKVRFLGSAALSLAWVAAGRGDAYAEDEIKLWDVAAGAALVAAAGGSVSLKPGKTPHAVNLVATNGSLRW